MTIFHLITGLEIGGTELFLIRNLNRLNNYKHIVISLTNKEPLGLGLEKNNIKVYELFSGKWFSPIAILRFRKIVNENKPDILVTYLVHPAIFGRIFGKLFGIPKIICMIRSRLKKKRHKIYFAIEKLTHRLVNSFISNSNSLKDFYKEKLKIPGDKIKVIYSPINNQITEQALPVNFEKNNNFIIGTVGRLAPEKRQGDIIKAAQILKFKIQSANQRIKFKIIILGDGPEKNSLQKLARDLQVEDCVIFLNYQSNVLSWLKIFDVFVLPSLYEGLSNALIEAMAVGLAVVVSDIPENKEIVQDNKSGLLFPTQQPKIIAEKILTLINDQDLKRQLGYQGQQFIKENFSEERFLEKINDAISK